MSHRDDPQPGLLEAPQRLRVGRRVRDQRVHGLGRADPGEGALPSLLESAATTTRSARSHSSRLIAASASSCAAAPCVTSKATTPSTATSTVICPSTPSASGPTSSYDWARATPPVSTILNWGRTASSLAMFSAFVTMVSAGDPDVRSPRTARARATSVVVVPPVSPTASPGTTRSATAFAMRCFSEACRAVL
ncbi:hypothetical protein SPURM210S_02850 [Streptomyces purpurascens]